MANEARIANVEREEMECQADLSVVSVTSLFNDCPWRFDS